MGARLDPTMMTAVNVTVAWKQLALCTRILQYRCSERLEFLKAHIGLFGDTLEKGDAIGGHALIMKSFVEGRNVGAHPVRILSTSATGSRLFS